MSETNKPGLEICLSPALLHLHDTVGKIVVIIDVFRATSTIAAAIDNGAECVIPVATVAECINTGAAIKNSITAGERDGKIAPGLQHGNSPSEYPSSFVAGKTLVLTTTNGTRLLHMIKGADTIITGAFLNISAVCDYLLQQNKSVVLGCASWKDKFNMEDTLFAGAVADRLQGDFYHNDDSVRAAIHLHRSSGGKNYINFLRDSAHYKRLSAYGLEADMEYCASTDLHPVVPVLKDGALVSNTRIMTEAVMPLL
ncbi:MAG: 2-phosphosulfolactate phosphatase [Flavipsychrobacter sp.]|nr:2-phosphosulfolactate phosphatase [Flavipsychrobacter sp.]